MKAFVIVCGLLTLTAAVSGNGRARFDLQSLLRNDGLTVFNRHIEPVEDPGKSGLQLSEEFGEGLVWINGMSFSTGTIEVDLKGQDVYQRSFLGIAFRGVNDSTFDAVYFRPFHFLSSDSVRKARGVQYISLPAFRWQTLREGHPGVYEHVVDPVPDPADWFHVRVVLHTDEVEVFVNNGERPSLRVHLLSDRKQGMIGLYTADRSGGSFANLSIASE
jgi:hypothetical protein